MRLRVLTRYWSAAGNYDRKSASLSGWAAGPTETTSRFPPGVENEVGAVRTLRKPCAIDSARWRRRPVPPPRRSGQSSSSPHPGQQHHAVSQAVSSRQIALSIATQYQGPGLLSGTEHRCVRSGPVLPRDPRGNPRPQDRPGGRPFPSAPRRTTHGRTPRTTPTSTRSPCRSTWPSSLKARRSAGVPGADAGRVQPEGAGTRHVEGGGQVYRRLGDEYGQRALLAGRSEGVDWEAMMHALRVSREAEELLLRHAISYPGPRPTFCSGCARVSCLTGRSPRCLGPGWCGSKSANDSRPCRRNRTGRRPRNSLRRFTGTG